MTPHERDQSVLFHILRYCNEINEAIANHGLTLDKIASDNVFKNALAMCILQIGELTNILSEEFRAANSEIPWREIKRMRDKAAHHYGEFDVNALWETVTEDIEPLKAFCLRNISV